MTNAATASRIARSLAFGGGDTVDEIVSLGAAAWADKVLVMTPPARTIPTFDLPDYPTKKDDRDARKAFKRQLADAMKRLTGWWLAEMIATPNPVVERVTFGWHNHFATSAKKVKDPRVMARQYQTLRANAFGRFEDLATEMGRDPALLFWLDATKNTASAPNENLSREFMELFCLGVDHGYTEADVRAGARALTGWRADKAEQGVRYDPAHHAPGAVTLLGVTGDLDPAGFVRAVLAQPQGPGYVVSRWWRRIVGGDAPTDATVARVLAAGDTHAARLRAMITSDEMSTAGTLVVDPLAWTISAARALGVPTDDAVLLKLGHALQGLGQLPFFPPSVGGWPSGHAWLSTSGLSARLAVAQAMTAAGSVSSVSKAGQSSRIDAVAHLIGVPGFGPRTRAYLEKHTSDPRALTVAALVSPESLVI